MTILKTYVVRTDQVWGSVAKLHEGNLMCFVWQKVEYMYPFIMLYFMICMKDICDIFCIIYLMKQDMYVIHISWYMAHHPWNIIYHILYVINDISYLIYHVINAKWDVIYIMFYIIYNMQHIIYHISYHILYHIRYIMYTISTWPFSQK